MSMAIFRQDGGPILATLAAANKVQPLAEVNILNTQADTFHQAQTTAVQEFGHEGVLAGDCCKQTLHLCLYEHGWWSLLAFAANRGDLFGQRFVKNIPIKKNQGIQGLPLR
jgi:hypothetical protein